jgi:hypothetical protein
MLKAALGAGCDAGDEKPKRYTSPPANIVSPKVVFGFMQQLLGKRDEGLFRPLASFQYICFAEVLVGQASRCCRCGIGRLGWLVFTATGKKASAEQRGKKKRPESAFETGALKAHFFTPFSEKGRYLRVSGDSGAAT